MGRRTTERFAAAALAVALGATPLAHAEATQQPAREIPTPSPQEIEREQPEKVREAKRILVPKKKAAEEPKEPEKNEGAGRVIVPVVMYSPETHLGAGGLVVQFFRVGNAPKESRVSSVAFDALVTTRKQIIVEIIPDLYWDDEKNHVGGKLEFQRFPDSFWGIGPRTPDSAEERYLRQRFRFRGAANRRLYKRLYVGLYTELTLFDGTYSDPNGLFARTDVPGERGGFTAGLGPSWSIDTRDNTVATRSGTLLAFTWLGYDRGLGSRYEFWRAVTEARQFFPVGTDSALGLRYYGEFQGGFVPFYQNAMLGGDELLRGYFMGRYRDKDLLALEAEYRFPIYWRFGGVTFAGAGEVADHAKDLASVPVRWAVGGGLRLSLNTEERLNLRLDAGFGPDTYGIYFTAREAF
ncbi:MAG TPA: BamA/TamA family outer membrane protein [Polyangiaceae bacterium]|nr:BamA/TamA family outer membrane protein [Polyangiaceae bacterium]